MKKKCVICGTSLQKLFKFPNVMSEISKARHEYWLNFAMIRRPGSLPLYLCGLHFTSRDFKDNSRTSLFSDCVPSLNPPPGRMKRRVLKCTDTNSLPILTDDESPASPLLVEVEIEPSDFYFDGHFIDAGCDSWFIEDFTDEDFCGSRFEERNVTPGYGELLVCYYCGLSSVSLGRLRRHIDRRHLKTGASEKSQLYRCTACLFSTISQRQLSRHSARHSEFRAHHCPHCPYRANRSHHLKIHIMARHTGEKPFQCTFCDYSCVKSYNLKIHIKAKHTGERPYKCKSCNYKGVRSADLDFHVKAKHTREKPFSCPYCHYECIKSINLKNHILDKHSEEKPVSCPFCHFSCVQVYKLNRHVRTKHTNGVAPLWSDFYS